MYAAHEHHGTFSQIARFTGVILSAARDLLRELQLSHVTIRFPSPIPVGLS